MDKSIIRAEKGKCKCFMIMNLTVFYDYEPDSGSGMHSDQDNTEYQAPDKGRLKRERQAYEEAEREGNINGKLSGDCGAEIRINPV